ncbi:hypothetical protein [Nocardia cyriacigeorgica]|uniref:hypothetical protein n=1 Tax=Nocardia cyriacigeorgica TaxID=135487 RepID=UPI002456308A|nr:hypothetical protein [Nocardia cyriacigeorgica]
MLHHAQLIRARLLGNDADNGIRRTQIATAAMPFNLPDPGRCSGDKTLTIAVFDDSPSVAGLGGSDPISQRYREARIAFRHLAQACDCDKEFAAVLHFDHPSSGDVPPARIRGRSLRHINRGLRQPREFGTSELAHALSAATVMAERFDSDHIQLVVFSDFMLTDPEPEPVYAALLNFPGTVHAVVLTAKAPYQLSNEAAVTVTHIDSGSESGEVAGALLRSLTEHRIGFTAA